MSGADDLIKMHEKNIKELKKQISEINTQIEEGKEQIRFLRIRYTKPNHSYFKGQENFS